jgi:hypothetical protein
MRIAPARALQISSQRRLHLIVHPAVDTPPPHILRSKSLVARSKWRLPLTLQRAWLGEHGPVRVQEPVPGANEPIGPAKKWQYVGLSIALIPIRAKSKSKLGFSTPQIPSTLPQHHTTGGTCGCSMMGSPFWVRCRLVIYCMTCDFGVLPFHQGFRRVRCDNWIPNRRGLGMGVDNRPNCREDGTNN